MKPSAWKVSVRRLISAAFVAVLGVAALNTSASAQTADLVDRSALRVCADPSNLPYSDRDRRGFENKIAELIGNAFDIPVIYTWFPQTIGFIRNTLGARKCDLVIGYAQGHELVQNTNHYYRSTYVLIYRSDSGLAGVISLDDKRLADKRIGVIARTPPATIMAMNGLIGNARPFQLIVDRRYSSPGEEMVAEIASGKIDAGVLWGPMGGYYAKQSDAELTVVPLINETNGPRMVYRITMGVRRQERDWKRQLNNLLAKNQDAIHKILLDYGVPLLDEQDRSITP